jgi:2-polyprenyl-3-methyl-5-hydroxy-6-metoxy-1,4-benzoquinol methylase
MKPWYQELSENYAWKYDNEDFTLGSIGEADFIGAEINTVKSVQILDFGCGTGRHSIELAKRGLQLTGVDLSGNQLESACKKAGASGISVDYIFKDVCNLDFTVKFNLVIKICEGLKSAGFVNTVIFECKPGPFSRKDQLSPGDYEMLAITEKPSHLKTN